MWHTNVSCPSPVMERLGFSHLPVFLNPSTRMTSAVRHSVAALRTSHAG